MGTLFPDDGAEHPDHQSIPSFPHLSSLLSKETVALVAIILVLYVLCPKYDDPHEHTHTAEVVYYPPIEPPDPMTWQNNSMFAAADVAIRGHHARAAQTRIAQMSAQMSSMNSALVAMYPSPTGR